jgi:hypothetical protein
MANLKISGTTNEACRIKIMDDDIFIGYKDVSAGAYSIVFPDQRPDVNPDDDFIGTNGDPPDADKWQILAGAPEIQSNNINMVNTEGISTVHTMKSRWVLTGDFYIRLRCNLTGIPHVYGDSGDDYSYLQIKALSLDDQNGATSYIRTAGSASINGHRTHIYKVTGGVWSDHQEINMGNTWNDAGLGIKRAGSSYHMYRYNSGVWYDSGVAFTGGYTEDVKITIRGYNGTNFPGGTYVLYSFDMVSGETVVSGTWPVHVYGVSDNTRQTIGYADIPSYETNDVVDIIEYPIV